MNTRERILTIRLLEKLNRQPQLAVDLGLEYFQDPEEPPQMTIKHRTITPIT